MADYSEGGLVERPTVDRFASLGWVTVDCFHEALGERETLGRETAGDVVLVGRLRAAIERLNPGLSPEAADVVVEEITRDRRALSLVQGNREVHGC